MINTIINGDCLEVMKEIPSKSVDMILCDLPYGTTGIKWDVVIPFDLLWEQYERIITDNGAIVLTASQPFTSKLIASNYKMFRYEWIWTKNNSTGFANAKKMPMKKHENICVFYKKLPIYNPQDLVEIGETTRKHKQDVVGFINTPGQDFRGVQRKQSNSGSGVGFTNRYNGIERKTSNYNQDNPNSPTLNCGGFKNKTYIATHTNFPNSILYFPITSNKTRLHPTEKPLSLWEYLIKTYTNEDMLVLDNCSGSGVTAEACIRNNRNYICIELDKDFYDKSVNRIQTLNYTKPLF